MRKLFCLLFSFLMASSAWSMPLGTAARAVIPADVQQIISVDYRALHNSDTAMALKQRVLPENIKQFESSLRGVGIDPDRDLEQLTFVSFRIPKVGERVIGIAQGPFPLKAVMKKLKVQGIKPSLVRQSALYPMGGMQMTFLDDFTLLFGDPGAIKAALNTRDGQSQTLDSNPQVADLIAGVDSSPIWSVLDQGGTQNMMRTALGDASKIADYETIKKRLLGSRYTMNFASEVNFDLDVVTSDSITAATLSSVLKAGVLYRKMTASAVEKIALENLTVDSDSSNLRMHFRTDDKKFQSLLKSDLFAAVAR